MIDQVHEISWKVGIHSSISKSSKNESLRTVHYTNWSDDELGQMYSLRWLTGLHCTTQIMYQSGDASSPRKSSD